jgi:hypothetical protein
MHEFGLRGQPAPSGGAPRQAVSNANGLHLFADKCKGKAIMATASFCRQFKEN